MQQQHELQTQECISDYTPAILDAGMPSEAVLIGIGL